MDAVREYFIKGGIFMFPIVGFTFWALLLICERFMFFWQTASRSKRLADRFSETLATGGLEDARTFLQGETGVIKNVLSVALEGAELPLSRLEKKVDTALLKELPALTHYLNIIATLAGLMPLLGLLGTVTGMITTFKVIALQGTGDAQAMADGIAEALITTQAGLVATVPIILFHVFLSNRSASIVSVLKASLTHLFEYLEEHRGKI
ncbi:MAG: hypothetical protein A2268_08015 [Candidatus Raymondbacteria bacterium RifOxyA12_full_50_37]|uniref:MotA/TolQ/ExbB proton channel domain-containing protein n=1 Tax=Candidatus Raymondbacteria bacterium RIFOXYD12_FULL_49_13 TaxID=1817890 RepID=A0A1F7FJM9_UNCRA|nr:MAG: hypothetical protein A2350_01395 [Candidatus Raymondbacteria bacterium RifOxyB12_full_50_8]OGJ91753.1 MAG: hypothetical protein A2268_08015 [Candidatus Raymondbacteria bacterium RifOxyA12_full_50_37]OGJ93513.1 MAG: hypothetical protein A2248_09060 [Candidatus Raymondbacteria bacterium RIFOXYA2_FULL_49_16]OGJ96979.1 MAG: hypothetical protein A2487_05990 [Candidatus Raymondbacteria bacterium RifOxyC12_full_50_8]OGJ98783.1 MAG: hypothetical protein A2453_09870 [Candidatus Raymondbacteria b